MDTSADQSTSVVLEEEIDRDYEPTEQEVIEYAEWLGMDMEEDRDLLWVAKTGLKAPLPAPWKPCTTGEDGEVFYFNFETGESVWDHPCDEYHRKLYQRERAKKHGLPYNDEEVEKAGRSLGLISAKDDAGDSLDNSAGLGGSLSASSSLAGDSKKKKKKDKKEKKENEPLEENKEGAHEKKGYFEGFGEDSPEQIHPAPEQPQGFPAPIDPRDAPTDPRGGYFPSYH